jgi:hypothetical protein
MKKLVLALLLSPLSLLANGNVEENKAADFNFGIGDCDFQSTLMMDCGDGTGSYYSSSCHDNAFDLWVELFEAYDAICS